MAIISGTILTLKLLAKQAIKKVSVNAIKGKAKKFVVNKAKDKIKSKFKKKKVKGKDVARKMMGGGGEKGGALALSSPSGAIVPSPGGKISSSSLDKGGSLVASKSGGAKELGLEPFISSLTSVQESVDSIKKSLNDNNKDAEERLEKQRLLNAKLDKEDREAELENKKSGIGKKLLGKGKDVADNFLSRMIKFFTMTMLGMLVNGLIGGARDVILAFRVGFELLKKSGSTLSKTLGKFKNVLSTSLKSIGKPFGKIGSSIKNLFVGLGDKVIGVVTDLISKAKQWADDAVKWLSKTFPKATSFLKNIGGKALNLAKTVGSKAANIAKTVGSKVSSAAKFVGNIGSKASNIAKTVGSKAKNLVKTVSKPFVNVAKTVGGKALNVAKSVGGKASKWIAKLFGKGAAKAVAGPAGKTIFKALAKGAKAIRIPVIGPLLVAVTSMLSGDPIGKTLFKTIGTAVGGSIGLALPLPVPGNPLSMMAGELMGEYLGNMLHILFKGGGIKAVGEQLKKDLLSVFNIGKNIAKWIGGGISRFVKNVITTDPITIPEGLGRRAAATQIAKFLGMYDWLSKQGFAGGKDGQIDKFPNFLNVLLPWKYVPLLGKSFFPPREEGEGSAEIGSQAANTDAEDVSESASYEDGAEEGATVVIDGGGGDQGSPSPSPEGEVVYLTLGRDDSTKVLNTLSNAVLYKV